MFCEFLKGIDFFGKLPEFYIKRKTKQVTIIGRIFTIIFIALYIIIFCYKIYRMSQRVDITFYDSYSNSDEVPNIKITESNFSLIFAVYDDYGEPFIDETIYYPKVYISDEEIEDVIFERCDLDKLGEKYKEFEGDAEIDNYYCLSEIDFTLKPFINSLRVEIFPCKNTTENNNHCETKEVIEESLNNNIFVIYFQDLMLTPLNYKSPVKERFNSLNTQIYNEMGQYLLTEMQLVRIETSTNIIGFDFLTNPKIEEFMKFDREQVIPYPGFHIGEQSTFPISIFEVLLNDKILLEKRQYIQLIDVLGEIGGLMEIIYSFFGVICSIIADFLYEKDITNNLFSFDIKNKLIIFKKVKDSLYPIEKDETIEKQIEEEPNIFPYVKKRQKIKAKLPFQMQEIKKAQLIKKM